MIQIMEGKSESGKIEFQKFVYKSVIRHLVYFLNGKKILDRNAI